MAQYIDKSAVVAEIERRIAFFSDINNKQVIDSNLDCAIAFAGLRYFIDTIGVKGVDLDFQRFAKEMDAIFALPSSETKNTEEEPLNWEYAIAKHFYLLGLEQKGE